MKKHVLIVEDEPKILEVLSSYIENAGYQPYPVSNGIDALDIFNTNDIDLVLLDLMLPDISGERICTKLRSITDIPIIMITAKTDEDSIIKGLEMGADDYITKPFSPRQLIARINALFRRIDYVNADLIGPFVIDKSQYQILFQQKDLSLTSTEFTILCTLMNRPTKVFTRDELASKLKHGEYEGFIRGIDSHIKNIRSKIANYTDVDYIKTVRGIGYQFHEQKEV